jgi:hypothetical protein
VRRPASNIFLLLRHNVSYHPLRETFSFSHSESSGQSGVLDTITRGTLTRKGVLGGHFHFLFIPFHQHSSTLPNTSFPLSLSKLLLFTLFFSFSFQTHCMIPLCVRLPHLLSTTHSIYNFEPRFPLSCFSKSKLCLVLRIECVFT